MECWRGDDVVEVADRESAVPGPRAVEGREKVSAADFGFKNDNQAFGE